MEDTPTDEKHTRRVVRSKPTGGRTLQLARAAVELARAADADVNDDGKLSPEEVELERDRLKYRHEGMKNLARAVVVLWLGTMLTWALYSLLYDEKISTAEVTVGGNTVSAGKGGG